MAFSKTQEFLVPSFIAKHMDGGKWVGLKNLDAENIDAVAISGHGFKDPHLVVSTADGGLLVVFLYPMEDMTYGVFGFDDAIEFARALGWRGSISFSFSGLGAEGVVDAKES